MKARTVQVLGRGSRARYVTPDPSYYWEGAREELCEDNKWVEEEKKCCRISSQYSESPK